MLDGNSLYALKLEHGVVELTGNAVEQGKLVDALAVTLQQARVLSKRATMAAIASNAGARF